jgi:hypothetical protein
MIDAVKALNGRTQPLSIQRPLKLDTRESTFSHKDISSLQL